MITTIRTGDTVTYQRWTDSSPRKAKVVEIELCDSPGEKYGTPVDSVTADQLDRCSLILDDGHWAYGEQVKLKN